MTQVAIGYEGGFAATGQLPGVMTAAMRCWRGARDRREPVQSRLYALLAPRELGVLAPVFDSLMTLAEVALGRAIRVGAGVTPSIDERLLIDLVAGERQRRACIRCEAGTASALDCAICSTRIMLALAGAGVRRP